MLIPSEEDSKCSSVMGVVVGCKKAYCDLIYAKSKKIPWFIHSVFPFLLFGCIRISRVRQPLKLCDPIPLFSYPNADEFQAWASHHHRRCGCCRRCHCLLFLRRQEIQIQRFLFSFAVPSTRAFLCCFAWWEYQAPSIGIWEYPEQTLPTLFHFIVICDFLLLQDVFDVFFWFVVFCYDRLLGPW